MWALIALGPNDIEIPCLIFNKVAEGRRYCQQAFGRPGKRLMLPELIYQWELKEEEVNWGKNIPIGKNYSPGDEVVAYNKSILSKLFTRYYGRSGEASIYLLRKIPTGKPFIGWNLD